MGNETLAPIRDGDRLTQYGFSSTGPPKSAPGVYAVCCINRWGKGSEHLLYIGTSKNMFNRVMCLSHPYRVAYDRLGSVYTRYLVTDDYKSIERNLIKTLRPLLNVHHNNG